MHSPRAGQGIRRCGIDTGKMAFTLYSIRGATDRWGLGGWNGPLRMELGGALPLP